MVDKSKDFENFLHKHQKIRPTKVTTLDGHETENELFLIGKDLSYLTFLNIITENINQYKYYSYSDIEKLENEIKQLKSAPNGNITVDPSYNMINNINTKNVFTEEFKEMRNTNIVLQNKMENLEKIINDLIDKPNVPQQQPKITTNFNEPLATIGPRLQKINPETLQLIKVYETASECMRENTHVKRPSLNKAVAENTVYNGYRWLFVDRELDPNIIHKIEPTKHTRVQNLGYIAKLNIDKNEILNVYLDRKTASHYNGYPSVSSLDNHVKNETVTNGHYYMLLEKCEDDLKLVFLQKHNIREIVLYINGVGQYDLENNLIREFTSKYDCSKLAPVGEKSLGKALNQNIPYNNYYYRFLVSKVKAL